MAKLIPVWDIVKEVFAERGIRLSPKLTLILCDKITEEINQELARSPQNGKRGKIGSLSHSSTTHSGCTFLILSTILRQAFTSSGNKFKRSLCS